MKKLLTTIFAVSTLFIFAQTPQGINYQSIIRSAGGIVLPNTAVNMEFKLYNGLAGALVYDESHSTTTNSFGMANLIIGQGSPISGTFNTITWANGIAYEVYVNSVLIGTKQLFMSVPYALHAGSAPAPTVTFTNNILSVGGNTTAISSGVTYTAGNGIDITGSIISGTANIVGTGATSVTGIYPNLTINTPTVQSYSAGNGINIDGAGVISNIAPAAAPYTLTTNSNSITINNGSSVSTATVPSYSAGNGINVSSTGVITNTASSTNLPAAFNGQFLYNNGSTWDTIPQQSMIFDPVNIKIGIGTFSPQANLHVNGDAKFNTSINTPQVYTRTLTVNGGGVGQVITSDAGGNGTWQALPNYSLTQSGANIDLTQNGTSVATITLTAATSTSLSAGNSNILLNQSGNAYTITPVTPTFTNAGPTTITGTYPNYTVNSVATTSTTLIQGNNIALNQSANTYTVSAPAYSISLPGGNTVQITNGTSTSTAAIASTSLTLTGANNNILSAGGNTVGVNTYTAGSGIAISGIAPNYTLSSPNQSLTINSNSLSITGGNTITLPTSATTTLTQGANALVIGSAPNYTVASVTPTLVVTGGTLSGTYPTQTLTIPTSSTTILTQSTGISVLGTAPNYTVLNTSPNIIPTITGTGIATVTASASNFTVNVPSPTYTAATGVLSFGTNTVIVTPTLALTGTTLTSGAATNSVNLSALNNWSVTTGVIAPTVLTNSVGVGINSTLGGRFAISHTSSSVTPHVNLISPAGGFGKVKFTNTGQGNYFSIEGRNNGGGANDGFSISQYNGTNEKPVFLVTGERKVNINNLNTVLASLHVMENASTAGGGVVSEGFARPGQMIIARNNQPALAARTAIIAGDEIGKLSFSGYNGAGFNDGGIISVISTEAYTGSSGGGNMVFRITPTGTINTQDIFKLGGDGSVTVNPNNSFSKTLLDVKGRLRLDSSLTMAAYNTPPNTSFINEGRIYYDRPSNKFKVSENGGAYIDLIGGGTSPWFQGAGVVTLNNISDKVGIGTATPSAQLHVMNTGITQIAVENTGANFQTGYTIKTVSNEWFLGQDGLSTTGFRITDVDALAVRLQIDQAGNVGIGTTAPASKLDIAETFSINGGAAVNVLTSSSSSGGGNSGIYSDLLGSSSGNYISGYFRSEALAGATGSPLGVKGLGVGNNLTSATGVSGTAMNGNQNTGVYGSASGGTTNYGVWGEVSGPGYAGYFTGGPTLVDGKFVLWPQAAAPAAFLGQGSFYYDNTSNKIMVAENSATYKPLFTAQPWVQGVGSVTLANITDNVGIGTTTPTSKLEISGDLELGTGSYSSIKSHNETSQFSLFSSNTAYKGAYLNLNSAGHFDQPGSVFLTHGDYTAIAPASAMHFRYANNGALSTQMSILSSGNVGIGTSAPSAKLDVAGTIAITGGATSELNRTSTGAANMVPICYGNITGAGTINAAASTSNYTVIWNATNLWYEITITGEAFNNTSYVTMITRIGGSTGTTSTTSALGGKLLVVFNDSGGFNVQNQFQFLVFKP